MRMHDRILQLVEEYIEAHDPIGTKLETRFPFRRLYGHCLRSATWARRLALAEGADVEVAEISALCHDIGKAVDSTLEGHANVGAEVCNDILTAVGLEDEKRRRIVGIVRDHIRHARDDGASLEAKVESDADLLDEIGALTVLWDAMGEGAKAECSYETAFERISQACERLSAGGDGAYHTRSAKRIFNERIALLRSFVGNLAYELGRAESPEGPGGADR